MSPPAPSAGAGSGADYAFDDLLGVGTSTTVGLPTRFAVYGTSSFWGGNVGIGTAAPGDKLHIQGNNAGGVGTADSRTLRFTWTSGVEAGSIGPVGAAFNSLGWYSGDGTRAFMVSNASFVLNRPIHELGNPIRLNPRGDVARGVLVTSGGNIPTFDILGATNQTAALQRWLNSAGTVLAVVNPMATSASGRRGRGISWMLLEM